MIIFWKVVVSLKIIHTFVTLTNQYGQLSICGNLEPRNTYNRNINFLQPGRCVRKQQQVYAARY